MALSVHRRVVEVPSQRQPAYTIHEAINKLETILSDRSPWFAGSPRILSDGNRPWVSGMLSDGNRLRISCRSKSVQPRKSPAGFRSVKKIFNDGNLLWVSGWSKSFNRNLP